MAGVLVAGARAVVGRPVVLAVAVALVVAAVLGRPAGAWTELVVLGVNLEVAEAAEAGVSTVVGGAVGGVAVVVGRAPTGLSLAEPVAAASPLPRAGRAGDAPIAVEPGARLAQDGCSCEVSCSKGYSSVVQ